MNNPFFDMAMYASFVELMTERQAKTLLVENFKMILLMRQPWSFDEMSDEVREDWGLI